MENPYEYYDNKLGVKIGFLIFDRNARPETLGVISLNALNKRILSKTCIETQLRRASLNYDALVLHSSLSQDWKDSLTLKFGKPAEVVKASFFASHYQADRKAFDFYAAYTYGEDNRKLDLKLIETYTYNASVMNAVIACKSRRKAYIKAQGNVKVDMWQSLTNDVNCFREVAHNLPTTSRGLRIRYNEFLKYGYVSFVSGRLQNQNARLVTVKVENLIISLYCLPTKPYVETVHKLYHQFLQGSIDIANIKTGELFDVKDFMKKNKPIELSVPTIWNIINAPENELIIKKYRNGAYDFSHKMRPHVNRTAPMYAMSKITLDDRDIMHTKCLDGSKVMAYYAFDVMSGCMIGLAHSKSKNQDLYIDCLRSMFRFTTSKGLGIPMQMEVEQHLVSDFKDGLMKAGNMFPFVRWCNPTNSQEKGAERFIGTKKYGVEKMNNQNVGRHYSKLDSNRTTMQKIFDAENDNYKEAKASFEQIVANELQEQMQYNNQLHHNQKIYPGQSRLEVFLNNINPDLPQLDQAQLAKYIGNKTETSIRRSQYVTVQYEKYQLSSPQILRKLQPNNFNVDAFYIPSENNTISEVYLYQNNQFLCECKPVPTFNTANSEWTDEDTTGYQKATKYISQFDAMVRNDTAEKLSKVTIIPRNNSFIEITPQIIDTVEYEDVFEYEYADVQTERSRAINDL